MVTATQIASCCPERKRRAAGFTLVELIIVIAMVSILFTFAIPLYRQHVLHARETVLRQNIYTLNQVVEQFTLDKQRAPSSLEEVVSDGYLRDIPVDPITNSAETWVIEMEDYLLSVDQTQPGITRVRSGAPGVGSNGVPYSEW